MGRRQQKEIPADLEALRERVEHWRATRPRWGRMPKDLWRVAAELAAVHGINPVARAAALSYQSLQKHTEALRSEGLGPQPAVSQFVEVSPTQVLGSSGTSSAELELVDGTGGRLTVRLQGVEQLDLAGLAQAFWGRQR